MSFSWYPLSQLGQAFHQLFCSGQPRRHANDFTPPSPVNEDQQLPAIPYYVEDNYPTLLKVTDENSYREASVCGHEFELSPGEVADFHAELERLEIDMGGHGGLDSACLEALARSRRRSIPINDSPILKLVVQDDEIQDSLQSMLRACEMCVDGGFHLRFSSE
jgi:hypothetical protein